MQAFYDLDAASSPQDVIIELCRQFYQMGWVSGTGGGITVAEADGQHVVVAPSGVQKERLQAQDMYRVERASWQTVAVPRSPGLRMSACAGIFRSIYQANAKVKAVIHTHSINTCLATMLPAARGDSLTLTHLEMIKGVKGYGYHDELSIPIVENVADERDLTDTIAQLLARMPIQETWAVLVRRHGIYVWGESWQHAKTQAECIDYLCEAAVRMHQMGVSMQFPDCPTCERDKAKAKAAQVHRNRSVE